MTALLAVCMLLFVSNCTQIRTDYLGLHRCGPHAKAALSSVTAVECLAGGQILCGARDGRLAVLDAMAADGKDHGRLSVCCEAQLPDAVSSIALCPSTMGSVISVGTVTSSLFTVDYDKQVHHVRDLFA